MDQAKYDAMTRRRSPFSRAARSALRLLESSFVSAADAWAARPASRPPNDALRGAKVVAHRGAHGVDPFGRRAVENTMEAFDRADRAGVWGLEMDMRWTADGDVAILHDPDLRRTHGIAARVDELSADELKRLAPSVPLLSEAIERFGGRRHLMLEAKADAFLERNRSTDVVRRSLERLTPGRDWHLLALDVRVFEAFPWAPPESLLPVAQAEVASFSRLALERGWAGLAGHFALLSRGTRERHRGARQGVGVGQIASRACLFREISRGADWLFTDRAAEAQRWIDEALESPREGAGR